jgi:type 1 glutamine amidotransferase
MGGGGTGGGSGGAGGGSAGSGGGAVVTPDAGPDGGPSAGGSDAREAAGPTMQRVLFYTHSTAFRHESIGPAVTALKDLLTPMGIPSDTTADPAMLTAANLVRYSGIVLINTNGKPFGDPGTAQIEALVAFVRGGGGLAGFHAASSTEYGATGPYAGLIGGDTMAMPGGFRDASCTPQGNHPSVAGLPTPFPVMNEEFYTFNNFNAANQVVLRCDPATGTEKIPISWYREEGAGRVFFSGLGHWRTMWLTGTPFLMKHALPAILWTLKR